MRIGQLHGIRVTPSHQRRESHWQFSRNPACATRARGNRGDHLGIADEGSLGHVRENWRRRSRYHLSKAFPEASIFSSSSSPNRFLRRRYKTLLQSGDPKYSSSRRRWASVKFSGCRSSNRWIAIPTGKFRKISTAFVAASVAMVSHPTCIPKGSRKTNARFLDQSILEFSATLSFRYLVQSASRMAILRSPRYSSFNSSSAAIRSGDFSTNTYVLKGWGKSSATRGEPARNCCCSSCSDP